MPRPIHLSWFDIPIFAEDCSLGYFFQRPPTTSAWDSDVLFSLLAVLSRDNLLVSWVSQTINFIFKPWTMSSHAGSFKWTFLFKKTHCFLLKNSLFLVPLSLLLSRTCLFHSPRSHGSNLSPLCIFCWKNVFSIIKLKAQNYVYKACNPTILNLSIVKRRQV